MVMGLSDRPDKDFWNELDLGIFPKKDGEAIECVLEEERKLEEVRVRELAAKTFALNVVGNQTAPVQIVPVSVPVSVPATVSLEKKVKRLDEPEPMSDSDYAISETEMSNYSASESEASNDSTFRSTHKPKKQKKSYVHYWSQKEDRLIVKGIKKYGPLWTKIRKKYLPDFDAKQIRQRYHCYLDPHIKRGPWSEQEILKLKIFIEIFGLEGRKKWQDISEKLFEGRRTGKDCQEKYTRVICKQISEK